MTAPGNILDSATERLFGGPLRVYGSRISYFTGKFEAYLRYRRIAYERIPMTPIRMGEVRRETGAAQMPAVELPRPHERGSWLTDTTPMIAFFEEALHGDRGETFRSVVPDDPAQRFVARLLEEYADEWLWRPAMHYRWSFRRDRVLLSDAIVEELMGPIPLPRQIKRWMIRFRQWFFFVRRDGVNPRTRAEVEGVYLRTLDTLEAILGSRPFLLGDRPTIVDYGFFGSLYRHFGSDPTPLEVMRTRAPAVARWVATVWAATDDVQSGPLVPGISPSLDGLFDEVGRHWLPAMVANAEAWKREDRRHSIRIGAVELDVPTSRYRVWCLERLRELLSQLGPDDRETVRTALEPHGAWAPLVEGETIESWLDPAHRAPFGRGLEVFRR